MNQRILLLLILLISVALPMFFHLRHSSSCSLYEKYTNLGGEQHHKKQYPFSQTDVLLQESYPITGRSGVSNDQGSKIWWHYPIFEVGSYDQITNNIRFSNNPDTGRCMPADVCGTLYKEKQLKHNYVHPLPAVKPECGSRVNYYYTPSSLLSYRADTSNILY